MSEPIEARLAALLQLALDRPADFVGMYLAESAELDKARAERDRARDLAVRAGAFDGPWEIGDRTSSRYRVIDSDTGEVLAELSHEFQARHHDQYWRSEGRAVEFRVKHWHVAHQDWQLWAPGDSDA